MEGRPVNLFMTESRLAAAFRALDALDAEGREPEAEAGQPTAADAEAIIAGSIVASDMATARRDEFARFLQHGEAHAAALEAEARAFSEPLLKRAGAIRAGLERMRGSALRLMERLGHDELRGDVHTLKVKRSRGSVAVFDQGQVPERFMRVREDEDLLTIRKLALLVRELSTGLCPDKAEIDRALERCEEATARRTAVDKVEIQKAWKEAGGDERMRTREELAAYDADEANAVEVVVTAPAERERRRLYTPVVPGAIREVTKTLEVK